MGQRTGWNDRRRWLALLCCGLVFVPLAVLADPITFSTEWTLDEGPSIVSGDAPVCSAHFTLQEGFAIGRLHVLTNQDSPFFGTTSQAEKQLQFEKPFTVEEEIKVALFAELVGTLRIEGGQGRVVVRAAALVLDASTYLPVAGLEITSGTTPDRFDHEVREAGDVTLQDSGVQIATLPAGDYIIVGSLEAMTSMARGWWNHEAAAEIALSIEFLSGT